MGALTLIVVVVIFGVLGSMLFWLVDVAIDRLVGMIHKMKELADLNPKERCSFISIWRVKK